MCVRETTKVVRGSGKEWLWTETKLQLLGWTVAFYELPLASQCRQASLWASDRQLYQPWLHSVHARGCRGDSLPFGMCCVHFSLRCSTVFPFSPPFFPPSLPFSLSYPLTTFPGSTLHPPILVFFFFQYELESSSLSLMSRGFLPYSALGQRARSSFLPQKINPGYWDMASHISWSCSDILTGW